MNQTKQGRLVYADLLRAAALAAVIALHGKDCGLADFERYRQFNPLVRPRFCHAQRDVFSGSR